MLSATGAPDVGDTGTTALVLQPHHAGPAGADQFYDSSSDDSDEEYAGGVKSSMPGPSKKVIAHPGVGATSDELSASMRVLCEGDDCVVRAGAAWEVVVKGDLLRVQLPQGAGWAEAGIVGVTHGGHSNAEYSVRLLETDELLERVPSASLGWLSRERRREVLWAGRVAQPRWAALWRSTWANMATQAARDRIAEVPPVARVAARAETAAEQLERRGKQQVLRRVAGAEAAQASVARTSVHSEAGIAMWGEQAPSLGQVWGMGIAKPQATLSAVKPSESGEHISTLEAGSFSQRRSHWRDKVAARKAARAEKQAT